MLDFVTDSFRFGQAGMACLRLIPERIGFARWIRVSREGVFNASHISMRRCVLSQNSGEFPKTRLKIRAVSAVRARRFRHSSFTCFRGRPVFSASSDCVSDNGSMNSSTRISPTLAGFRFVISMCDLPVFVAIKKDVVSLSFIPLED